MTDPTSSPEASRWHVPRTDLERYALGAATPSLAASVEPHLESCPQCRGSLAVMSPPNTRPGGLRLNRVLDDVLDSVDRPLPSGLERLLCRLGVADHAARLLVATPAMQLSWLVAVAATLGFTVLATRSGGADLSVFLVGAPLVPMVAVAAAFSLPNDTNAELTITAPVRTSWLLILRSVLVLSTTLLLCGVAAVALPSNGWENAAWVLPALALATTAAALSTWAQPVTAASTLAVAWVAGLMVTSGPVARRLHTIDTSALVEHSAAFAPSGQLMALGVICISVLVLLSRRDVLDLRSTA
jgi:hypothetical protein